MISARWLFEGKRCLAAFSSFLSPSTAGTIPSFFCSFAGNRVWAFLVFFGGANVGVLFEAPVEGGLRSSFEN